MQSARFVPGDQVFIHAGRLRGAAARILSIDERTRSARVSVISTELKQSVKESVLFEELCLFKPRRRPVEEDMLLAIERAVAQRHQEETRRFWMERRSIDTRRSDRDLAALLAEEDRSRGDLRVAVDRAYDIEAARFREAMVGLTDDAKLERWQREHVEWLHIPPSADRADVARSMLSESERAHLTATELREKCLEIERRGREVERLCHAAAARIAAIPRYPYQVRTPAPLALDEELTDDGFWSAAGAGMTPSDADLRRVGELRLESHLLCDLSRLARLPMLSRLEIISASVVDITPIAKLSRLTHLTLRTPRVRDISPLASLSSLTTLALWDVPFGDLSPIAKLPLTTLVVRGSRVRDHAPLSTLRDLRVLEISLEAFERVEAIASLGALENLWLCDVPLSDIAPLTRLGALRELRLSRAPIAKLAPLAAIPSLASLFAEELPANDLDAFIAARPEVNIRGTLFSGGLGQPAPPLEGSLADRIAALGDIRKEGYSREQQRRSAALAMSIAGSREPGAIAELVRDRSLNRSASVAIRGLLSDERRGDVPFAKNPWGITPDMNLRAAIARVWAPLALRAPAFIERITEETLALALIGTDAEPELAYVLVFEASEIDLRERRLLPVRRPRERSTRSLHAWIDYGDLVAYTAAAPRTAGERIDVLVDGLPAPIPLPLCLRELAAVHGSIGWGTSKVETGSDLRSLARYREEKIARFKECNDGELPYRFIHFQESGSGDGHVLDLVDLDERGDPKVRTFDHETWQVGTESVSFWHWFEKEMPRIMLSHSENEVWHHFYARFGLKG